MEDRLLNHVMDIKERLAKIETTLTAHVEVSAERDVKLDKVDRKVTKAEASLTTIRWGLGIVFISIPGVAAALVRVFGKG